MTNAAGAVTDRMTYDAWGNIAGRTGTTAIAMLWIGELGYYFDRETGGYHVRARPYVASIGSWRSQDPARTNAGFSLFVYVSNCPVSHVDPSGMWQLAFPNLLYFWRAEDGDTFDSLVELVRPVQKPSTNRSCIIPYCDVKADDWKAMQITIGGVYDTRNIMSESPDMGGITASVGSDFNNYIRSTKHFFNATQFDTGVDIANAIRDKAQQGDTLIRKLIVIGHGSPFLTRVGGIVGEAFGERLNISTNESFKIGDLRKASKGDAFRWTQSLEEASAGHLAYGCWFSPSSQVFFVGCFTAAFAGEFARLVLRKPAVAWGTQRPTWAPENEKGEIVMGWGKTVTFENGASEWAFDDSAGVSDSPDKYLNITFDPKTKKGWYPFLGEN